MIERLGLLQPPNRTAREPEAAVRLAREIGYPLVVRPSYVLGGRAMEIVHQEDDLRLSLIHICVTLSFLASRIPRRRRLAAGSIRRPEPFDHSTGECSP